MNISTEIEQFILQVLGGSDEITLSRSELAQYFSVAPSQINYVLATRFTLSRGFIVRSKRGGGGGITLVRIAADGDLVASQLKEVSEADELPENRARDMAERLHAQKAVTDRELALILASVSESALKGAKESGALRRNIYKEILIALMRK
ncbi:MAG TPA: CtsR family transcriptional regulator [Candidatus Caccalectryoclostridium excrementigallinarum]|uniref:CtsR family transcriptional regulator n=1 Tax=Candidatus Caccalectryoclostridium excrementigallinarum TaxID=2840710 RepID=A0A9D1MMW8_9FIRM|nr:CtsR family transcriptional regulator [Candidatus Caccalectryoclostridium excrementigallinarum]